jgi:hypothetical protein
MRIYTRARITGGGYFFTANLADWVHPSLTSCAALRLHLEAAGAPMGPSDRPIAAHALAERLVVVTGNVLGFSRVPDVRVENRLAA